ncbi:MAG: hypothetical protein sL5_03960 [Candidatus Mesenet longicola]|uniref:Uncharacterized protein n=1 Tax=Candidatus Mesenet longicola TaxID=1892558 RepID=A0A8J3MNX4_9RICK|nr:MAG: hypothetical protein sGL2_02780 [Candidatus Mesenet longicola]GHM59403.1 MAG: hypothetical protein sL5_03960 [Candidatus Mesenet longicola]
MDNAEKVLLASVKEDDPHKESKRLEIKKWYSVYWPLMESWGERKALFFQNVFSNKICWEVENASNQVTLNRYTIGKRLLILKAEDGQKNLLNLFDRYRIACWCCFEEEIKAIFEEFKSTLGNKPVESLVKGCNKGALMIYWSHAINNQEHQLKLNNEHPYVYAFRCAMIEKHVEALEFFWNKLQLIDSIPLRRKEDLLMEAAYNKGHFSTDNVGMVDFCLRYLREDKYYELLKRDFRQNKCYYTLSILRRNYSFESAKKLFKHLKPEDLSYEEYATSMFSALNSIVSVPDDNFIEFGSDMLASMWNCPGFETHRQHYLHDLSVRLSSRDSIVRLIRENKAVKVLSEIINSLSQEQMQSIMELNESEYKVFTRVRDKQLDNSVGDSMVNQSLGSLLNVETVQQEVTDVRSKV